MLCSPWRLVPSSAAVWRIVICPVVAAGLRGGSDVVSFFVFSSLNKLPGVKVEAMDGGTNIYLMKLPAGVEGKKFSDELAKNYFIAIRRPNAKGELRLEVNETLLYRDATYIIDAIKQGLKSATK